MPIVPDTKNWTWVLEARCPECSFDARSVAFADVPDLIRSNAAAWPAELARPAVRTRPDDATWSPLEYAAHVRDVFRTFEQRLALLLTQETPTFPDWDQDATAVADRYHEQDPTVVAQEIREAGERMASAVAAVPEGLLGRAGLRSNGSRFTVDSLTRYTLHDPIHHLHDVRGMTAS